MRRERHRSPSTRSARYIHEERSNYLSYGCENSTTSSDLQCSISHFFMKKKKKGDVTKKETLSDYLQEYEAQSKEFKDHLKFQGFCKIKK